MMTIRTFAAALAAALFASVASAASPAPLATGEHNLVVNGVRLWYRVAGPEKGVPVVFLHGGPGEGSQAFARYPGPGLEKSLRMVYLDQRGSGRSERPWTKDYSFPLMVEDLERLRRAWRVEKIAVVGHSFGAALALEYAAAHPEHVSRLVLAGALVDAPAMIDLQCDRLRAIDPAAFAKATTDLPKESKRRCDPFSAGRAFIDGNMFPRPATAKLVDEADSAGGLSNTGEIGAAFFAGGLLDYRFAHPERLTMPLLVIGGEEDFQTMGAPARALVAAAPNARFLGYPGDGHFMFVDSPDKFARDLTTFLAPGRK